MSIPAPSLTSLESETGEKIYDRDFWLAYAANVVLVTANALTLHFAELVNYLGGTEQITGAVIRTGLIGALVLRLAMGQVIDRYGAGKLWTISAVGLISGLIWFTLIRSIGWELHAARILFSVSLAGMFTCSIVHIQNLVPAHRRTEVIGNLGSSGFVGMIIGSQAGDFIMRMGGDPQFKFYWLFGSAAALVVIHLALAIALTWNAPHERPSESVSALRLLVRYWPGPVVAVALMMGVAFAVTTVFLRRHSTLMGLGGIGTFFTAYAVSAFFFRIGTSDWSYKYGRHAMVMRGLAGHIISMASLIFVTREWHYIIPAVAGGFGHALLFPAVVSMGSGAFPKRYRGMGTTLTLGFVEAGVMISAPLLGALIDAYAETPGTRFGFIPMFATAAGLAVIVGVFYLSTAARTEDVDTVHEEDSIPLASEGAASDEVGSGEELPEPVLACQESGNAS
ncbi:MAG TPA: MFS transporter [Planctomycetaceae bacterium]|nr:MFS transporter [Planctomycetaceae bacterium]